MKFGVQKLPHMNIFLLAVTCRSNPFTPYWHLETPLIFITFVCSANTSSAIYTKADLGANHFHFLTYFLAAF
jgi:hypothetical protein